MNILIYIHNKMSKTFYYTYTKLLSFFKKQMPHCLTYKRSLFEYCISPLLTGVYFTSSYVSLNVQLYEFLQ